MTAADVARLHCDLADKPAQANRVVALLLLPLGIPCSQSPALRVGGREPAPALTPKLERWLAGGRAR